MTGPDDAAHHHRVGPPRPLSEAFPGHVAILWRRPTDRPAVVSAPAPPQHTTRSPWQAHAIVDVDSLPSGVDGILSPVGTGLDTLPPGSQPHDGPVWVLDQGPSAAVSAMHYHRELPGHGTGSVLVTDAVRSALRTYAFHADATRHRPTRTPPRG